jgi:hypothetical protein
MCLGGLTRNFFVFGFVFSVSWWFKFVGVLGVLAVYI